MMSDYFTYLLKVSAYLAAFYSFYWIALRHTTFHQLNRGYLLTGLAAAFILPFVRIQSSIKFHSPNLETMLQALNEPEWFLDSEDQAMDALAGSSPNWNQILLSLYIFIALIVFFYSVKGISSILKIKKKSVPNQMSGIRYITGPEIRQPFSFFKWIFYPAHSGMNNREFEILKHEKAHADQWHTLDLLFVELITIVLWFNPFVFLFRQSLKQVHEYLADSKVAETPEAKAEYLSFLVSTAEKSVLSGIASQFYWLKLKKRIKMITKNKTTKLYKLSYLFIVPIIALSTMAFSSVNFILPEPVQKAENIPSIAPIKEGQYKISSGYGMRKHPIYKEEKMHNGIDLKAPSGTQVIATADGVIVKEEYQGSGKGFGRFLIIKHDDTYQTVYTQLSEYKVQVGDKVKKGDIIGLVGSSGISTGPHLHYEVWKNGERINPVDYFE